VGSAGQEALSDRWGSSARLDRSEAVVVKCYRSKFKADAGKVSTLSVWYQTMRSGVEALPADDSLLQGWLTVAMCSE
jgi:hypothetical protein